MKNSVNLNQICTNSFQKRVKSFEKKIHTVQIQGHIQFTVKPVLSDHSKIGKTKVLKTDYRLMQVKSIAECFPLEHSAILLTCIKRQLVLKPNFGLLSEVPLKTGFTVLIRKIVFGSVEKDLTQPAHVNSKSAQKTS